VVSQPRIAPEGKAQGDSTIRNAVYNGSLATPAGRQTGL
jgi:hypothetical protein